MISRSLRGAIALLLVGALGLFFEVVFRGRVFFYGDLTLYFLPELAFLRDELLAGRIPLWNPYVLCGQPFVGNPQTWPLYPSTLLLFLFPAERMVVVSTLLHVLWAGVGMLAFLRTQKLSSVAAALGAVVFAFSGALISKAQFPNMLQAMSWLPWLLWGTERLLQHRTIGRLAALALCVGLTLLAAHAQVALMQLYLLLAWIVFRGGPMAKHERLQSFGTLTLATLLGLGLALAQLLPVVEHALASTRPQLSLGAANRFYLPWRELVLLVAPNALGNPAFPSGWHGKGNFWEPCCYIGLIPLMLALRGGRQWFWLTVTVLSLWLALGRYGGLYLVAFYLLPGVKVFHDPARWLYLMTFALAVLAAYGLENLRVKATLKWGLVCLSVLDLVLFSRTLNPTCDASQLQPLQQRLATQGRVFHLRPYAGWRDIAPYKSYAGVSLSALGGDPPPNVLLWSRTRQAGGYEPVARRDVTDALKALGELPEHPEQLTRAQRTSLEALGVRRVVGAGQKSLLLSPLSLLSGGVLVSERPGELVIHPAHAEVIVRETHSSGWRVFVDQQELPVESEPPFFMKVSVPTGMKRVIFRYDPVSWRVGVFLSLGAGCILGTLMLLTLRNHLWRN